jgi:hypothetical protein
MDNWISNLAAKAMRICRLNKQAVGNHRQDMTRPVLEDLGRQGYSVVTWDSGNSTHGACRDLNRQTWTLNDFMSGLEHDAPLFEKSHPGDENCTLIVSGQGLPDVKVDSYGDTDHNIGMGRPVKTPTAPKPVVKPLAPKPEPKVVEKPEEPKKKVVYIPKEVHKQIKDPFEKQKLSPEEYEEWLKDLEKENVEESIPSPQLTDEDREEWLKDLERETSKAKVKPWIYGIFKG